MIFEDYPEKVRHYFFNTEYAHPFSLEEKTYGLVSDLKSNEHVQIHIKINADKKIIAAFFKAKANPFTVAACAYTIEQLLIRPVEKIKALNHLKIAQALDIPKKKLHSAIIVEQALIQLLNKWLA